MEPFIEQLTPALSRFGPWLVFFMTMLETSCFIGLLLPAEATILLAAFLASQGLFSVEAVLLATIAGGFTGDQIGYALGRFGGERAAASKGRIATIWRRHEVRAHTLFRRHSLLAISAARFVSFVRTLMPSLAGMTGMRYRRFVIYDALGVVLWGTASVAAGFFAGKSWDAMANLLGYASVLILAFAIIPIFLSFRRRRSRAGEAAATAHLYRVGLTGNIASGKSAVADVWRRLGAYVVDADQLARAAVAPGTPALKAIVARFGKSIANEQGMDRAAMRAIVFNDANARGDLERIIHPQVERLRQVEEVRIAREHGTIVVHMIPLLFEARLQDGFDEIVFVDAPADERERRLIETRGLDTDAARAMMAAQASPEDKLDEADHVLENDGTLEALEEKAERLWRGIVERAADTERVCE